MNNKKLILYFVLASIFAALIVIIPAEVVKKRSGDHDKNGGNKKDQPKQIVVQPITFSSNANNYLTACFYAGPFDTAPKIADMQTPVVGRPATSDTVWKAMFGKGDIVNLADVEDFQDGQYFMFEFQIAVPVEEGKYKLRICGTGEIELSVDNQYILTKGASDLNQSWFNQIDAPGDFSYVPRRVSIAVKARYGNCGLTVSLIVPDTGESVRSISSLCWPSDKNPGKEYGFAESISIYPFDNGILLSDSIPRVGLKIEGGVPNGYRPAKVAFSYSWDGIIRNEIESSFEELFSGKELEIELPRVPEVSTELSIKIGVDNNYVLEKKIPFYVVKNIAVKLPEYMAKCKAFLEEQGSNPDLELRMMQYRMAADTLTPGLAENYFYSTMGCVKSAIRLMGEIDGIIEATKENKDFFAGKVGELERAYISEVDGSPQPYKVYLPDDYYTKPKPRGVVIFLHGYVPDYNIANWGEDISGFARNFNRMGMVVFQPYGRSNTDFQTVGEDDVLKVYKIACSEFRADKRSIHLIGVSMGGMGVWSIGSHYPDLFASITPLAGRTDYYYWKNIDPQYIFKFERFLINLWNPMSLTPNFFGQNVNIFHGQNDRTVKPYHSQKMAEVLEAMEVNSKYTEIKNGEHGCIFQKVRESDFANYYRDLKLPPANKIKFRALLPKYASRSWLSVPLFDQFGKYVDANGTVDGDNIDIQVSNALRVVVKPCHGILNPGQKVRITINEKEYPAQVMKAEGITIDLKDIPEGSLLKTPEMCGPGWQITTRPFALVYGDDKSKEDTLVFAQWWKRFASADCRIFSASEITPEIEASYDLIIHGDPETHSYLKSIADSLPVKIKAEEFVLPNGKSFQRAGFGVSFIYPNPRANDRLVMVFAGERWGVNIPYNHLLDFMPDYIVFEPSVDKKYNEGRDFAIAAGIFDTFWKFSTEMYQEEE